MANMQTGKNQSDCRNIIQPKLDDIFLPLQVLLRVSLRPNKYTVWTIIYAIEKGVDYFYCSNFFKNHIKMS